jgi:hypothetical protein
MFPSLLPLSSLPLYIALFISQIFYSPFPPFHWQQLVAVTIVRKTRELLRTSTPGTSSETLCMPARSAYMHPEHRRRLAGPPSPPLWTTAAARNPSR